MSKLTIGQNQEYWTNEWENLSIESEIHMWDFFGCRPWILKYVPRYGKVVEAGCGLGRYVFFLKKLGIDIEGIDFSGETIEHLIKWKNENDFDITFKEGDVTNLPYGDNSISGYLSFGVIEHFIEGPQNALNEAFRVLKPGGITIITTPSKSWTYYYLRIRKKIRNIVKLLLGKKIKKPIFFQYWYTAKQLKKFAEKTGFNVIRYDTTDMLYTFYEFYRAKKKSIKNRKWVFKLSQLLDKSFVRKWGAQSVLIAMKPEQTLCCFFCGENTASIESLKEYDVPVSKNCMKKEIVNFYKKSASPPYYHTPYFVEPEISKPIEKECEFSKEKYKSDKLFEQYGFSTAVNPALLKNPEVNIKLANTSIKAIWRERRNN